VPEYIKVKAHPNAKKELVVKKTADSFEIWVKEKAEQGRANDRIQELMALELGISKKQLKLVSGSMSPAKKFILLK
jgi:uncharacterized protein YggU (UPF0235/DUF167 family)